MLPMAFSDYAQADVAEMAAPVQIDFPSYSQLDRRWGFPAGHERRMCSIICLKAVLDYFAGHNEGRVLSAAELHELLSPSRVAEGFRHRDLVDVLKGHGLVAWRRDWAMPSHNGAWLQQSEGYDDRQLAAMEAQQTLELAHDAKQNQHQAMASALEAKNPVIASMKPYFGGNRAQHQVVVIGWERRSDGNYYQIMDPEPGAGNIYWVRARRFFGWFTQRAIFAQSV